MCVYGVRARIRVHAVCMSVRVHVRIFVTKTKLLCVTCKRRVYAAPSPFALVLAPIRPLAVPLALGRIALELPHILAAIRQGHLRHYQSVRLHELDRIHFSHRKRVKRPPTSQTGLVVKRCATREYELFFDSCARRVLRRHRLPHPCLRCQIPSHALSSGMAGSGKIRPFASKTRRPAIGWRIVRVLFHHSGDLGRSPPVRIGQWWRWHAICHDCMPSVRICR